jgi:hypothetical protein
MRRLITDTVVETYGQRKFTNSFDADEFKNLIRDLDPAIVNPIDVSFTMSIDVPIRQNQNTEFSFSNELLLNGVGLQSSIFNSTKFNVNNVYIQDTTVDPDTAGFSTLRLVSRNSNGLINVQANSGVGEINPRRGFVRIFPGVASGTVRFTAFLANPFAVASRNMILNVLQSPTVREI